MVLYRSESGDDPHDEVEPVIPNGESLDFDDRVRYLDHVNVYPVFQSFAIGPFFSRCVRAYSSLRWSHPLDDQLHVSAGVLVNRI